MMQIKALKKVSFDEMMQIEGEVFRNVDGRKTLRFIIDGHGYFIKQHFGVGWKEIFKNFFQFKIPVLGAKNEYLAIQKLKSLGIDTMEVVGFAKQGINPATMRSFIVTEDLDNTVSLEDYCEQWLTKSPNFSEKLYLINKVAKIVKKLHENGINHRDLYICHFLMRDEGYGLEQRKLFLIDLHRTQMRNKVPTRWLIKDLAALYFSAMNIGLSDKDWLRFIKAYRDDSLRRIFESETVFWQKVERKANILNGMPDSKKKR